MNENGRYQAIRLDATGALILDTQEGHLWIWGVHKETGIMLIYQGQVSLGKKAGEVIIQALNKEEA